MLLETKNLSKSFGGVLAANDVNLHVRSGEIVALIGPNGAGKTTMFNLISGVYAKDTGDVLFEGKSISNMSADRVAATGVVRTFQNLQIFSNMTVLENVMTGCHLQGKAGFMAVAFRWFGTAAEETKLEEQAMEYLALVSMADRAGDEASALPFGQQRLVEIARALAARPKLLLLDEPAAGLTHIETDALDKLIHRICDMGVTVLLVEHDMNLVMGIADRIAVLNYGQKIADGSPAEVQSNPEVIQAYLGADFKF